MLAWLCISGKAPQLNIEMQQRARTKKDVFHDFFSALSVSSTYVFKNHLFPHFMIKSMVGSVIWQHKLTEAETQEWPCISFLSPGLLIEERKLNFALRVIVVNAPFGGQSPHVIQTIVGS